MSDFSPVFVDTNAWIGLFVAKDRLHTASSQIFALLQRQNRPLITTSAILFEVVDGFAQHGLRHLTPLFRVLLNRAPNLEIVHVDAALFQAGWQLFEARPDKEWVLTDCVSFALMSARGLSDALTHDHHFQQAGFRALLRD